MTTYAINSCSRLLKLSLSLTLEKYFFYPKIEFLIEKIGMAPTDPIALSLAQARYIT